MQRSIFEGSAVLVHAAEDAQAASELAAFLRNGLPLEVNAAEGRVSSTLVAAFQEALSASFVIVLLSRQAVTRRGSGLEWEQAATEAAEFGTQTASVPIDECVPPAVLRRGPWFDGSQNRLAAFRALKRWLLAGTRAFPTATAPEAATPADAEALEDMRRRVADVPGSVHLPAGSPLLRHLVRSCQEEFEAVVWMDCQHRAVENFLGELGEQLGLVLDGPVDRIVEALARHLQQRRVLLAFENFQWHGLMEELPSSRYSLVTTAPVGNAFPDPAAVLRELRAWQSDEALARRALAHANAAFESALDSNWELAREIGRLAALVAQRHRRNAEAFRWLDRMEWEALHRHERQLAFDSARERAWIAEAWGQSGDFPPPLSPEPEQLSLFG